MVVEAAPGALRWALREGWLRDFLVPVRLQEWASRSHWGNAWASWHTSEEQRKPRAPWQWRSRPVQRPEQPPRGSAAQLASEAACQDLQQKEIVTRWVETLQGLQQGSEAASPRLVEPVPVLGVPFVEASHESIAPPPRPMCGASDPG